MAALGLSACEQDEDPEPEPEPEGWQLVHEKLPGALLSVWGTSSTDMWTVGGDALDGTGPLVLHFDGETWEQIPTGQTDGNLWWVFGFEGGPMYVGGDGGVILRYENGAFSPMETPGVDTVFGIWGATPDDVWAVGGASASSSGFAWRLSADGSAWEEEPSLPVEVAEGSAIWKVYGTATDDAWLVGSNGVALHWDGSALSPGETGVGTSLFTVHEQGGRYYAVGGTASGIIVEYDGNQWSNVTPEPAPMGLTGVFAGPDEVVAVGVFGGIYTARDGVWQLEDTELPIRDDLHGSWIDEKGDIWIVCGQTLSVPLTDGVLVHRGTEIPSEGI